MGLNVRGRDHKQAGSHQIAAVMGETARTSVAFVVVRRSRRCVVMAMGMAMLLSNLLTVAFRQAGKRMDRGGHALQGQRQEHQKQSQLSPPEFHERAQCKQNAKTAQSSRSDRPAPGKFGGACGRGRPLYRNFAV